MTSTVSPTAPDSSAAVGTAPVGVEGPRDKPRGLLGDAWRELRRKPLFWMSAVLITLFVVIAAFPGLFTSADPTFGELARSRNGPSSDAWFGYDLLGRDVFARVIYGTRASIVVSILATLATVIFGGGVGVLAGYRGGWVDALLSRIADIFFGVPFFLGAIVILFTFNTPGSEKSTISIELLVVTALATLVWPVAMRIMRSSVLAAKQADYILAARAMGAGTGRIIFRHLIPNCLAPLLVYSTILIGAFIGAEATLSYLGVGLRPPVVSWGIMIAENQDFIRVSPQLLLFPAAFLVVAVLSFVMLGEAVREALDPKLR
jgi:oligopeptide transport system permease protein